MPPFNPVAIIPLERMVIVVIALTVGDECEQGVIPRRTRVAVSLRAPYVCNRVDQVGHMLAHHQSE